MINFIIVLSIIIVSYFGVYFIGGNVYLTIMKSTIFISRDSKKIELQPSQYEFKLRNPIISNVIRDAKLIMRIQSLHVNCITANTIFSIIGIIMLIICRKLVISIGRIDFQGIKSFLVILWFLTFQITNGTIITSFSREGRSLNQLKVFPLEGKKILLSKIFIGIITNILSFINTNVLIALISSNFTEFILLEIVLLTYMIATVIIEIEIDLNSMELKWVAIKDLFLGHYLKILKPYFILTLLPVIYILVAGSYGRSLHIELTEYLNAFFIIFIGIIYSLHSFKKIIKNMT